MSEYRKYILFWVIVLVSLAADQGTKMWAEARLANPAEHPNLIDGPKTFEIPVQPDFKGQKLYDVLRADLEGTDDEEVMQIARNWIKIDEARVRNPDYVFKGTEKVIVVRSRKITVVPNFFHFRYTRNPGAAFGLMANQDSDFRRPFFVGVSILAIVIIMFIFRKVEDDQQLLIWSLGLIVGGAVGNFIDRVAYGWVIDFIDWHYYREFTWPTINIADTAISIGVGLMALEIVIGMFQAEEPPEGESSLDDGDAATQKAADG
ncbi:MAG: signal peptidase II [Myxococcota bacterium]